MTFRHWILLFAFMTVMTSAHMGAQSGEIVLPVLANGEINQQLHFESSIQILNKSATASQLTLQAYASDGKSAGIFLNNQSTIVVQVQPGGTAQVFTSWRGLASEVRWVRLISNDPSQIEALSELSLINSNSSDILTASSTQVFSNVQVPGTLASRELRAFATIAFYGASRLRESAFGFVNPSSTATANVQLNLVDWHFLSWTFEQNEGRSIPPRSIQIPPRGMVAFFLSALFPDIASRGDFTVPVPFRPSGTLKISSDVPIAVGAIDVLFPEGKWAGGIVRLQ